MSDPKNNNFKNDNAEDQYPEEEEETSSSVQQDIAGVNDDNDKKKTKKKKKKEKTSSSKEKKTKKSKKKSKQAAATLSVEDVDESEPSHSAETDNNSEDVAGAVSAPASELSASSSSTPTATNETKKEKKKHKQKDGIDVSVSEDEEQEGRSLVIAPEPPSTLADTLASAEEEEKEEIDPTATLETNATVVAGTADVKHLTVDATTLDSINETNNNLLLSSSKPPTLEEINKEFGRAPEEDVEEQGRMITSPKSSQDNNGDRKWKRMVVVSIFIIVVLLAAVLGFTAATFFELRRNNDKDSSRSSPTSPPTSSIGGQDPSPTGPSLPRSSCPTQYQPLAGGTFATQLFANARPQDGGPSEWEEEVTLRFDFPVMGQSFESIFVSPNGLIRFYPYGFFNYFCASDCGGIAIAQKIFVAHKSFEGELWVEQNDNAATISWENIGFDGSDDTNVNAQVTLYPTGDIDLCWAEGRTNSNLRAGLWLSTEDSSTDLPVIGDPFDDEGITVTETAWPTNQCRYFRANAINDENAWGAPDSCPGDNTSCESSTQISTLPFQTRNTLFPDDPSSPPQFALVQEMSCPGFDLTTLDIAWFYELQVEDGSCACVELRSSDGPFAVGIFRKSKDGEECDGLSCFSFTDFPSTSIVWRTDTTQIYYIVVTDFGSSRLSSPASYTLSVTRPESSSCSSQPGQSSGFSGSCPVEAAI